MSKTRLKLSYNKDEYNQTIFDRVVPLGHRTTQWHLFAVSLLSKKLYTDLSEKYLGQVWCLVQSNNF